MYRRFITGTTGVNITLSAYFLLFFRSGSKKVQTRPKVKLKYANQKTNDLIRVYLYTRVQKQITSCVSNEVRHPFCSQEKSPINLKKSGCKTFYKLLNSCILQTDVRFFKEKLSTDLLDHKQIAIFLFTNKTYILKSLDHSHRNHQSQSSVNTNMG